MYRCIVCKHKLHNTPYYNCSNGKVCENCYEAPKGIKSDYLEWLEKNNEEK